MSLDRISVKKMVKFSGEAELSRILKGAAFKIVSNFEYEGGKNYIVYVNGVQVPNLKTHIIDVDDMNGILEIYKHEDNKEILLLRVEVAESSLEDSDLTCSFLECSFEEFFQVCSLLNLAW